MSSLEEKIVELWGSADKLSPKDTDALKLVEEAIELLDSGKARVAEPSSNESADSKNEFVMVNSWLKTAILLYFRLKEMETTETFPFEYHDKMPLKTSYQSQSVRVVPGASARWGSFLAPGVVMMPSYVNIGAFVDENTMVDTWATVGSCAQIGKNVHLSGGVGIGGVLEPPNAVPVIIGDECLIGSRCVVADGARVGQGTVLGAGSVLTGSIPVIDVETGEEISRGVVPQWCVAVPGSRSRDFSGGTFSLPAILVIKRIDPGIRHDKSALNEILRDHGTL